MLTEKVLDELYAIIRELRERIVLPETRQGTRLFEMLRLYRTRLHEGGFTDLIDDLAETNPELHELAISASSALFAAVREVTEDGVSPEDFEWKSTTIAVIAPALDAFLATRPPPPVNGGRRRKTRRRKNRRYSRRR